MKRSIVAVVLLAGLVLTLGMNRRGVSNDCDEEIDPAMVKIGYKIAPAFEFAWEES